MKGGGSKRVVAQYCRSSFSVLNLPAAKYGCDLEVNVGFTSLASDDPQRHPAGGPEEEVKHREATTWTLQF